MKKNKLLLAATFAGVAVLLFFCGILFAQGMGRPHRAPQMPVSPMPGPVPPVLQENPEPDSRDQMLAKIIELRTRRHEYDKVREIASQLQMRELAVGVILAQAESCGDGEEAGQMLDLATELLGTRCPIYYPAGQGQPVPPRYPVPMNSYMPEGHFPQQQPMMPMMVSTMPQGQGQPMPMPSGGVPITVPLPDTGGAVVITQSIPGPGSVTQTQPFSKKTSTNKEKPYTAPSYSGSFYGLYPQQPK
ncbi:MAG: hypothetical protein FWC50_00335 [Planctomycetaceae bacterium]|nr:hypothetical protein [Planctomycetaceae bacterium]